MTSASRAWRGRRDSPPGIQHQDAAIDRGPDRLADGLLGQVRDGRDQALVHRPATDGHDAQDGLAGVRQRRDLGGQRLGQGSWQGPGPAGPFALHELLDEVRDCRPTAGRCARRGRPTGGGPGRPRAAGRPPSRSSGARSRRTVAGSRSRLDSQAASGSPRSRPSERTVRTTRTRSWSRLRARNRTRSWVARSTQCRSSMTSTPGRCRWPASPAAPGPARTGGPGPGWRSGRPPAAGRRVRRWAPVPAAAVEGRPRPARCSVLSSAFGQLAGRGRAGPR